MLETKALGISCLCSCIATDSDHTNRAILFGKAVRLGKKEIVAGWPLSVLKLFKNRIERTSTARRRKKSC